MGDSDCIGCDADQLAKGHASGCPANAGNQGNNGSGDSGN
jgi:hypothetical protein